MHQNQKQTDKKLIRNRKVNRIHHKLPQNQAKEDHFRTVKWHLRGCGDYMLPETQYLGLFYT